MISGKKHFWSGWRRLVPLEQFRFSSLLKTFLLFLPSVNHCLDLQANGISAGAQRIINTKTLEFKVISRASMVNTAHKTLFSKIVLAECSWTLVQALKHFDCSLHHMWAQVSNKTEAAIFNMKKFGDISVLSTGDKIKANETATLKSVKPAGIEFQSQVSSMTRSQGLRTASGVVTFRIEGEMMAIAIAWAVSIIFSINVT